MHDHHAVADAVASQLNSDAFHGSFAAAPHASFEVIDDAGHYTLLETPVRVASIIEKHIASAM
jgi:3-oxoadipate enol-lactonase